MLDVSVVLFVVFGLLAGVAFSMRLHSRRSQINTNSGSELLLPVPLIPGKLPIIGHAHKVDFSRLHHLFHKWSKTYGDVFSLQLYNSKIVVLSSYDGIYEALVERGRDFAGRPYMYRTDQAQRDKHSIVWQSYTPKLHTLRKHVQKYVKVYGTGMDLLEERCYPEIQRLIQNFNIAGSSVFDPWDYIYCAVCNVMILLLLGKRLKHSDPDFRKIVQINRLFNDIFGPGEGQSLDYLPWFHKRNAQQNDDLQHALRLRDEFFEQQILPLKVIGSKADDCIMKSLLEMSVNSEQDINIDTVKEVFTNLLLAGTDTTATALTCLILVLINHQNVQNRLQEEVDLVVQKSRLPAVTDKHNMPYMEAVILELLRFISHVPLAVPHCTMNDTTVKGFHIPANTTVHINLWSMHHDESYWSSPWTFNPERFLNKEGKLVPPDHPSRRRLMAFGAGRRVCLGETLAKNRLFLFASALLQNFSFEPESKDNVPDCDPRSFRLGLVLHPEKFKIRAIPRI